MPLIMVVRKPSLCKWWASWRICGHIGEACGICDLKLRCCQLEGLAFVKYLLICIILLLIKANVCVYIYMCVCVCVYIYTCMCECTQKTHREKNNTKKCIYVPAECFPFIVVHIMKDDTSNQKNENVECPSKFELETCCITVKSE